MTGVPNPGGPPPAPNPQPDAPSPSMGLRSAPQLGGGKLRPMLGAGPPGVSQSGALYAGAPALGAGQQPAQGQPQQPPAPTHGQTVAALRHFDAIKAKLASALRDPAVGKSNIKKKIVDGMAELVADRIFTPAIAAQQLASVPDEPFQQKQWLLNHYRGALQGELTILVQHAAAHQGVPEHMIDTTADPDNHLARISHQ